MKRADLMARKPEAGTSTVKVWTIRRTATSRANLVEFSGRSPMHIHPDAEHTLMVIEGSVTVKAGDDQIRLDVGDYVSIPPHMPHAYWVEPGGRALLVSFDAPAYDDAKTIFLEPRR